MIITLLARVFLQHISRWEGFLSYESVSHAVAQKKWPINLSRSLQSLPYRCLLVEHTNTGPGAPGQGGDKSLKFLLHMVISS